LQLLPAQTRGSRAAAAARATKDRAATNFMVAVWDGGIKEDVVGPVVYFSQGRGGAGRWTSLLQAGAGSVLYPPRLSLRPDLAVTLSHASSQERLAAPTAPHQGESGRRRTGQLGWPSTRPGTRMCIVGRAQNKRSATLRLGQPGG
jgi:hypothetical protein